MVGSTHQSTKNVEDSVERLNKSIEKANKSASKLNGAMLALAFITAILTLVQVIHLFLK